MAQQKYTDAQKTAMVKRVNEVRAQGHSLKAAIEIVRKEKGFEFANRPTYQWWTAHLQGKPWVKANATRQPKPPSEAKVATVVDSIRLALNDQPPPQASGQMGAPRGTTSDEVKLKALELLSKILSQ